MSQWRRLAPAGTDDTPEPATPQQQHTGIVAPDARKLAPKQRLALVHNSSFSSSAILAMADEQITFEFLLSHSISPTNVAAASLDAVDLFKRGASDAFSLTSMGFDALHLTDTAFCESCMKCYGSASVVAAFLKRPSDAVALAGSGACHQLGLDTNRLLVECAGAATEALAVLRQQNCGIQGVCASTLLDTGLRSKQLQPLGLTATLLLRELGATPAELIKLGYVG
jgi:hypothetical protein